MEKYRGKFFSLFYLLVIYLMLVFTSINVFAENSLDKGNGAGGNQPLSEWMNFREKFGHEWKVQWDPHTGLPHTILT